MSETRNDIGYQGATSWTEKALATFREREAADAASTDAEYAQDFDDRLAAARELRASQVSPNEAAFAESVAQFKATVASQRVGNLHERVFGMAVERPADEAQGESFDSDKYEKQFGLPPGYLQGIKTESEAREGMVAYYGQDVVAAQEAAVAEAKVSDALRELASRADKHADEWRNPKFGDSTKGLSESQLYERQKLATHVSRQISAHLNADQKVPPIGALLNRARLSLHGELPGRFEKPVQPARSIHHAVLGAK